MNKIVRKLAVVAGGAVVSVGLVSAISAPADAAVSHGKERAAHVSHAAHGHTSMRVDSSWPC